MSTVPKEHHCKLLDESHEYIYFNNIDWVMNNNASNFDDGYEDYIMIYCHKCGKKLSDGTVLE